MIFFKILISIKRITTRKIEQYTENKKKDYSKRNRKISKKNSDNKYFF